MLETLYALGITPSNSRPRVSNDNPYSESLFKTLKYRPNYQPRGFANIEDARNWCAGFVKWYRYEHHHSGIRFLTPASRHEGKGKISWRNATPYMKSQKQCILSAGAAGRPGTGAT